MLSMNHSACYYVCNYTIDLATRLLLEALHLVNVSMEIIKIMKMGQSMYSTTIWGSVQV